MKCSRLQLQERLRSKTNVKSCITAEKPLRYCQKRMINPEHEEDPRWSDIYGRFHFNEENDATSGTIDSEQSNPDSENLFLSVQTLKFQGVVEQPKRSRSSFMYKRPSDGAKHRMFVKQAVLDDEYSDDGRLSQLTTYYFDDYVQYLFDSDKSRPNSGKSNIFLQSLSNKKENKATQVDEVSTEDSKTSRHGADDLKVNSLLKNKVKEDIKDEVKCDDDENTQITFQKSGRKKSLTISRTQSPETVQVIRVDVVCNTSRGSVVANYEDKKLDSNVPDSLSNFDIESINLKKSHFADKYLLSKTVKTLDENLSSGEKVTFLCKTYKLSDRPQELLTKPRSGVEPTSKPNCKNLKKSSLKKQ